MLTDPHNADSDYSLNALTSFFSVTRSPTSAAYVVIAGWS